MGLIISAVGFGQTTDPIENSPPTQTTTSNHYITVYTETPSKQRSKMFADYSLPWIYGNGFLRPRSIATNVMIGTASNLNFKLAVNGTFGLFDDMTLTGQKRYKFSTGQYMSTDAAGNLIFLDPITGSKTLAQLAAGGSANIIQGNLIVKTTTAIGDSISVDRNILNYNPSFETIYTGALSPASPYSIDQSLDGRYIIAAGYLAGIRVSDDLGSTFTEIDSLFTPASVSVSMGGQYMLIGALSNKEMKSNDYGITFTDIPDSVEMYWTDVSQTGQFQVGTKGNSSTTGYIFQSSDYGATFARRNLSFTHKFIKVKISSGGDKLTAITLTNSSDIGGIWVSADSGYTWTQKIIIGNMMDLACSKDLRYQIAIGPSGTTYATSDYGVTWGLVSYGSGSSIYVDISDNGKDQILFKLPSGNIEMSRNYGSSWQVLPLTNISTLDNMSLSGNGRIILTTFGTTIKRYNVNSSLEIKKPIIVLGDMLLSDSARMSYEGPSTIDNRYVVLSKTGALKAYIPTISGSGIVDTTNHSVGQIPYYTDKDEIGGFGYYDPGDSVSVTTSHANARVGLVTDNANHNATHYAYLRADGNGTYGDAYVAASSSNNTSAVRFSGANIIGTNTTNAFAFYEDSARIRRPTHFNDTIFFDYLAGAATGSRFLVFTSTGAADSGVLHPVWRGLEDQLWDLNKHLADRKNKEIRWVHIDDITKDTALTYGLPNGMDAFEALQYTSEMSLRLIQDRDKRMAELERRIETLEKKINNPNRINNKMYLTWIVIAFIIIYLIIKRK